MRIQSLKNQSQRLENRQYFFSMLLMRRLDEALAYSSPFAIALFAKEKEGTKNALQKAHLVLITFWGYDQLLRYQQR
ncbi:MAG: hypothetical protein CL693_10690 [Cellvibrionaceae bacterium]|nr:hypothetical protein [Cellvibrionaceae bacterium]|tara:strand:+ start:1683 stop:1913 length:231 start_codon:yes stop_codon:yes gene_type:complete